MVVGGRLQGKLFNNNKKFRKKVRLQLTMTVKNISQIRDVKLKSERDIAMFIFVIFTVHGVVAHVLDVSGYRDRM
jgi:CO dehydrogenase/acetyl-CoA synthase epsilon subunit